MHVLLLSQCQYSFSLVTEPENLGLLKDEMDASVATLKGMQPILGAEIELLREKSFTNNTRFVHEYLVRRHIEEEDFMEVR